jgi:hypothetical protein
MRVRQAFGYVHEVPGFSFADKLGNQWLGALAMWLAQVSLFFLWLLALSIWPSRVWCQMHPFLRGEEQESDEYID